MSTPSSSILRGCTPVVAALFITSNLLSAMPEVAVQARVMQSLSYQVQFWGNVETSYEGRSYTGGEGMQPVGSVEQILPGLYQFTDGDSAFHDDRIYQLYGNDFGLPPGWADHYPVEPAAGEEVGPLPYFEWQPYQAEPTGQVPPHEPLPPEPGLEVMYEFQVYELRTDRDGARILPNDGARTPILSVGGLLEPSYQFQMGDPVLRQDRLYAYNVNAVVPFQGQVITGRAVPFHAFMGQSAPVDWHKLFALIRQLQEELKALRAELDGNPLIQEVKLIEQLISILADDEKIREFIVALLKGEFEKLKEKVLSPEMLVKVLNQLVKLIDYFLNYDTSLSSADKNALKFLKNRLEELIGAIKRGQQLSQAWEDLQAIIAEIKELVSDPVGYLVEQIKDKLIEQLTKHLAKHLGAKAAGAIVSILVDLVAAGHAVLTAYEIAALEEEINKRLITAIEEETRTIDAHREIGFRARSGEDDCLVTVAYKKRCFKKAKNGSKYTGTWEDHPVRMKNGAYSDSAFAGKLPVENGRRRFEVEINPADLTCPPGEGPCFVYLEFTIECPDGTSRTHKVFVGVINC